ncbi:Linker for activation of T-cells family member 2 [Apodemus speciosus]|uniref:Linker for activation of T-cells family member 2 n=1 Tax=Apodemus speciosus TaxID=105296 RepID=A0ABQ0ETQ2_APOSI
MSAELELLWPLSGLLLLLLGATAWLCVRCSRPGVKRNEKIYQQRNQQENDQSLAAAHTYSLARQVWPGPQMDTASDKSFERGAISVPLPRPCRKNKLPFSHLEGPESPRYQNFYKGSRQEPDAAYVDPIPTDYYNWGCFQKSPEDDDSNSYENVLICKPSTPEAESGPVLLAWVILSGGVLAPAPWTCSDGSHNLPQESRNPRITRTRSPFFSGESPGGRRCAQIILSGSPDEESDYVNGDVASAEKI